MTTTAKSARPTEQVGPASAAIVVPPVAPGQPSVAVTQNAKGSFQLEAKVYAEGSDEAAMLAALGVLYAVYREFQQKFPTPTTQPASAPAA